MIGLREWLARLIAPPMCGHKIRLVTRFKQMDTWDPESMTIIPGDTYSTWQECALRPGHSGEHGGWQRLGRIRLTIANRLSP